MLLPAAAGVMLVTRMTQSTQGNAWVLEGPIKQRRQCMADAERVLLQVKSSRVNAWRSQARPADKVGAQEALAIGQGSVDRSQGAERAGEATSQTQAPARSPS